MIRIHFQTLGIKSALLAFCVALGAPLAAEPLYKATSVDVRFSVDHPFKRVDGTCSQATWDLAVKGSVEKAELAAPGRITVSLSGIVTGNSNRDSHALEVLGFPSHKEILAKIASVTSAGGGSYTIAGTLTIRGTERPFTATAKAAAQGAAIKVTGGFGLKMTEFGLERPSLLGVSAKDDVSVSFTIVFEPAG